MIFGRLRRLGFSSLRREDYESFTKFREDRDRADGEILAILAEIQKQTGVGVQLPPQGEPTGEAFALGSPADVLDLMRIAAHLEGGALPEGPRTASDPSADPVLEPFLLRNKTASRFPHLLGHAESSGYYVPLDFPAPFWLVETSRSVGSAVALVRELTGIREALASRSGDFPPERAALAQLLELTERAARESLTAEIFVEA